MIVDAAFVGGMLLAPLAFSLAVVAIVRLPPGRAKQIHVTAAGACAIIHTGALVSTFWWWGIGFDQAATTGVASAATDRAMVTSFWIAAAAFAGLALAGLSALATRSRLAPMR